MRKFIAEVLVLSILFTILSGIVMTSPVQAASNWSYPSGTPSTPFPSGGNGQSSNPYKISTAQELANLAYLVNNSVTGYSESTVYYELSKDIDLGGNWTPIGINEKAFAGHFNGKGFSIKNLYCDISNIPGVGLFGTSNGVISNLVVSGSFHSSNWDIGGIVGKNTGTISNCQNFANISMDHVFTTKSMGGIAAVSEGGSITNCKNYGTLLCGQEGGYVGGIVGSLTSGATIAHCGNMGTVEGSSGAAAGGIAGNAEGDCSISNSYNIGNIQGKFQVGGISGNAYCPISNCFNVGTLISETNEVGTIAGASISTIKNCYWLTSTGSTSVFEGGASVSDCVDFNVDQTLASSVSISGSSYTTLVSALNAIAPAGYQWDTEAHVNGDYPFPVESISGTGTSSSDPYLISTAEQLWQLSNDSNSGNNYAGKYIKLKNNITLNNGAFSSNGSYSSGMPVEWIPIKDFAGTFDGGGYSVRGVYINNSNDNQGLFGVLNGTVKSLGVTNSYIKGKDNVGAVAGSVTGGLVNGCYSNSFVKGDSGVGGIIGRISTSGNTTVQYCQNSGNVSASTNAGGIVGASIINASPDSLTIQNCFNVGTITVSSDKCGGITAMQEANGGSIVVKYCYNAGDIIGTALNSDYTGGLVAAASSLVGGSFTIESCYNTGRISTGSAIVGSFVENENKVVGNCFYDKQYCSGGAIKGADIVEHTFGRYTAELRSDSLISWIGGVATPSNWVFTGGLYPRLSDPADGSIDMDGTDAAFVSVATAAFDRSSWTDMDKVDNVRGNFSVGGADNGIVWSSSNPATVNVLDHDSTGSFSTRDVLVSRGTSDLSVVLTAQRGLASRSITLNVKALNKHDTPAAQIDFINERLAGLVADADYKINSVAYNASSTGTVPIDGAWYGTTLSIVKSGNNITTQDSTSQSLVIPTRLAAPVAPVLSSKTSSSITLTSVPTQEYSLNSGLTWQNSGVFSGLSAATTYSAITRTKATSTTFASVTSAALLVVTDASTSGSASSSSSHSSSSTKKVAATEKTENPLPETTKDLNTFTDVSQKDWFFDAVEYVRKAGLMRGTSNTTFEPNLDTNRAMLVTMLWKLENEPQTTPSYQFKDISSGSYYAKAVAWSEDKGIIRGLSTNSFGPNDQVTREQLTMILWRYAKDKGYTVNSAENISMNKFTDSSQISRDAIPAMGWAYSAGLINGRTESKLAPKGYATRAEVAKILMLFNEKIAKAKK